MGDQSEEASILERLARIETKLDVWHTTHADHETRIRSLERKIWLAMGAAAVGGGTLAQVVPQLFH